MKARIKENYLVSNLFEGELKVTKKSRDGKTITLENGKKYPIESLVLIKESGGKRIKKTIIETKFKVGDSVKLKKGLIINKNYGGLDFLYGMFFKKSKKIIGISERGRYFLESGFYYSDEMLELVTKKKKKIEINLDKVNEELRVGEYKKEIEALNKECESWMNDCKKQKEEKLLLQKEKDELEVKYKSKSERLLGALKDIKDLEDSILKLTTNNTSLKLNLDKLRTKKILNRILLVLLSGYFISDVILFFLKGI